MYLSAADKKRIVDMLTQDIPELQSLYLFGSQSDGTASQKSDVDIAYLSKKALSSLERWQIAQKLAILLGLDVDLIELSSTNTIFRYQILSTQDRPSSYKAPIASMSEVNLRYVSLTRFSRHPCKATNLAHSTLSPRPAGATRYEVRSPLGTSAFSRL